MHRDTVTRSWSLLLHHSSAAITSGFSMIMQGPMSQGSVDNSWKLRMSPFFHGLNTRQTGHPLSLYVMLWIEVYDSVFLFTPIPSNFAQPLLKRSWRTFHMPQSPDWSTHMWRRWIRRMVVTPDKAAFLIHATTFFMVSVTNRCFCISSYVKSID
jgi:hypothetical protein